MANEGEFIVLGILIALVGFLLIISPVLDNMATSFFKIKSGSLYYLAMVFSFGGIAIAVIAARSGKKPR
jgi:high-affinity Fe2+/Pb2+ permease